MIEYEKRAMIEVEDKYTFRQSTQISMQTGLIGHLRADMDTDGNGFFSSWFDFREELKTDEFKAEFDEVINSLREEGDMLDNRYALLFIRGERPVQDFKYDILHHPNVRETTDGGAPAFTHGEDTRSIAAMSFVFDPIEVEKAQKFEPQLHDFELLSEEELQEKFDKKEKKEHEKHQS